MTDRSREALAHFATSNRGATDERLRKLLQGKEADDTAARQQNRLRVDAFCTSDDPEQERACQKAQWNGDEDANERLLQHWVRHRPRHALRPSQADAGLPDLMGMYTFGDYASKLGMSPLAFGAHRYTMGIRACRGKLGARWLNDVLRDPRNVRLVLADSQRVAGLVSARWLTADHSVLELQVLCVDELAGRQGIADRLLRGVLRMAASDARTRWVVLDAVHDQHVRDFYARRGFRPGDDEGAEEVRDALLGGEAEEADMDRLLEAEGLMYLPLRGLAQTQTTAG